MSKIKQNNIEIIQKQVVQKQEVLKQDMATFIQELIKDLGHSAAGCSSFSKTIMFAHINYN